MKKNNLKKQKGVSIYLVLMIMAIFLDLSLGLSMILFGEILNVREIGYSVVAFYAADSGAEEIFYKDLKECKEDDCSAPYCKGGCVGLETDYKTGEVLLDGVTGAFYSAGFEITSLSPLEKMASSTGSFQKIRRAVQVNY